MEGRYKHIKLVRYPTLEYGCPGAVLVTSLSFAIQSADTD
jgi:hypothetical protein